MAWGKASLYSFTNPQDSAPAGGRSPLEIGFQKKAWDNRQTCGPVGKIPGRLCLALTKEKLRDPFEITPPEKIWNHRDIDPGRKKPRYTRHHSVPATSCGTSCNFASFDPLEAGGLTVQDGTKTDGVIYPTEDFSPATAKQYHYGQKRQSGSGWLWNRPGDCQAPVIESPDASR